MSESNRTQFAMRALTLADYFNAKVGDRRVSGYQVKLAAPDGPSTGGGKQALQHISLIPDAGGATITAGSANPVAKTAELRSYRYLEQLHRQRFGGKGFLLDKVNYNELLKRMQTFFADQGLSLVLLDSAPGPADKSSPRFGLILLGLLVSLATAGAVYYLLGR